MLKFLHRLFRREHVLICEHDGRLFISANRNLRYCSLSCALDADKAEIEAYNASLVDGQA